MARKFKLKVNLTYKEAATLVLEFGEHEYCMRRHDEYHTLSGRNTLYITKLHGELWRITGKGDIRGDRQCRVTQGKDAKWYVFAKSERPSIEACYKKYLRSGGEPIKRVENLIKTANNESEATTKKTAKKTTKKTKVRKKVSDDDDLALLT